MQSPFLHMNWFSLHFPFSLQFSISSSLFGQCAIPSHLNKLQDSKSIYNICRLSSTLRLREKMSTTMNDDNRFLQTVSILACGLIVPKIFPFFRGTLQRSAIGLIRKRDASPRDGQHPLRGDGLLRRTVSRSVGTLRKQFPRHAEIVRSSPRVAWDRGTCPEWISTCCLRTTASFCLRIFDRSDSMNRYQADTRTLRNRPRVRAPLSSKVFFCIRELQIFYCDVQTSYLKLHYVYCFEIL